MNYYHAKKLTTSFDSSIDLVKEKLSDAGFGVLTQIDMQGTIKKKLDRGMDPYVILGACHPESAFKAVTAEPWIGLMLPCNVVIRQTDDGVEVAAVSPQASMMSIENEELGEIAQSVEQRLEEFIESL